MLTSPAYGTNPAHTIAYAYDNAGRKLYEKNDGRQVSYQYDLAGNRARTTWPDGYFISYLYDALNRMTFANENSTLINPQATYTYDLLSRRTNLKLGGSATNQVGYTYEPDNDLSILTHTLNATTLTLNYGHNHSHQITGLTASDSSYLGPSVPLCVIRPMPVHDSGACR